MIFLTQLCLDNPELIEQTSLNLVINMTTLPAIKYLVENDYLPTSLGLLKMTH